MKRDLETRKTIEEIQTTYVLFAILAIDFLELLVVSYYNI